MLLYFQLLEKDILFILNKSIWDLCSILFNLQGKDSVKEFSGLVLSLHLEIIHPKGALNILFKNPLLSTELPKKQESFGVITIIDDTVLMCEVSGIPVW